MFGVYLLLASSSCIIYCVHAMSHYSSTCRLTRSTMYLHAVHRSTKHQNIQQMEHIVTLVVFTVWCLSVPLGKNSK